MRPVKNANKKLTSLKLDIDLFKRFKDECAVSDFTLQKLAERSMFLYLDDPEFKRLINSVEI